MFQIEELRSQIEESRNGKHRGAVRYQVELRERVVAHTKSAMASGETLQSIARCLGIATETLRRWMRPAGDGVALRPVMVAAPERSSGCVIIKCTLRGICTVRFAISTTAGPMLRFGTKWPSMMSM